MPHLSGVFLLLSRSVLLLALILAACSSPEQKAQNYYERGNELLAKQDYVKAALEFKNALQLKKDMVGAWRGLLEAESHSSNPQDLVLILRNIVELDPKDIDAKLRLGKLFLVSNALDQALELANAATAADPKNPMAVAFRAAVLLQLNDPNGAKREAQEALALDPKNADALIVLAAERMRQDDLEGALQTLDREADVRDKNLGIQLFKLNLLEKAGKSEQTEVLLRKLIELYPKDAASYRAALIQFYINHKRPDDAEKELRAIASENPSDVDAGLNLVRFLQRFKGAAAARRELEIHIDAGVQPFKYQMALAALEFSQGQVEDSVKLLEKLATSSQSKDEMVAAKLELAQIQLSRKNYDVAQSLISEALNNDERNIQGLKLRAALRLAQGQLDQAIADLRQALNDQPHSSDLMVLLANAYERSGSIDLAEKQLAVAMQESNYSPAVTLDYIAFLRRRGNLERAEDIATELARRWPKNVPVLTALAELRLARQNWSGAQLIADSIQHISGAEGIGDEMLAASLSGRGKYEDSIRILQSVHTSAPTAVKPIVDLVNTMARAGQLDRAVSFLQNVLKENPANAEAHVLLGSIQLQKNAAAEAVQSFLTAIEKQAKNPVGYTALADLYIRHKEYDEAKKIIRAGLNHIEDNIGLHQMLASVFEHEGQYESAIAEYEYILKQQPGSLTVANNLASLLSEHRTDKASLERAYSVAAMLRKSPVASFKDTLGWIDYVRGDYASATRLLEEAAAALPNQAAVQYHLGMSYVATGQIAKASEQFKKALALTPDSTLQEKISAAQKKAAM